MTRSIHFRALAEEEYLRASSHYERERAGLGAEFETEVESTLQRILDHPERYAIAVRDIREAPTRRFPYCIYYRVRGTRIVVLAVFHQSRNPDEWQART